MEILNKGDSMDDLDDLQESLVQLARLSISGREQDSTLYVQRLARKVRRNHPQLSEALVDLLRKAPTRSSPLRRASAAPMPVDADSRLSLIRVEELSTMNNVPILAEATSQILQQLIDERHRVDELTSAGLTPTRTALFLGPPGVGKTMAARWIATSLQVPLLILDLSAVMSSLLGKTGVNLRYVLDYAKSQECVLLIDELDSIGKRRNDDSDIGELKRLVNVLLQQIDDWPSGGSLLLGATNHPELLDPAIWRRFEVTVEFSLPDVDARREAIRRYLNSTVSPEQEAILADVFESTSFSEIETALLLAQRGVALGYGTLDECIENICSQYVQNLPSLRRRHLAASLVETLGISQRRAHDITGVSRDTIRKIVRSSG